MSESKQNGRPDAHGTVHPVRGELGQRLSEPIDPTVTTLSPSEVSVSPLLRNPSG